MALITPRFLSLGLYIFGCTLVPPKQLLLYLKLWEESLLIKDTLTGSISLHHQANPTPNPSLGPYTREPLSLAQANPAADPSQSITGTFPASFT